MPRVLVVDDEPEIVDLLREFLTLKGYEVVTASDGPEALQMVKAERPHAVLLDIRLPRKNGLEVLHQVRTIDREVRVIMITGVSDPEIGQAALQLGATDYIRKPLDLEYLEQSLWHAVTPMTLGVPGHVAAWSARGNDARWMLPMTSGQRWRVGKTRRRQLPGS